MGEGDRARGGAPEVVPSSFVRLLFEYLEERGADAAEVLGERPPDPGERGLGRYPLGRWARLLERASAHLDDPQLGLHLGARFVPRHGGVLAHLLQGCDTVDTTLRAYGRYEALFYGANLVRYRTEGASLVIEWGTERGRPPALVAECAIAALVRFSHEVLGPGALRLEEVCFVHPAPDQVAPYERYFGCPVRFDRPTTRLRAPLRVALPLRSADPVLHRILERQADAMLEELATSDPFERDVRQSIERLLHDGPPSLVRVAAALHTSPRTLQRRLAARSSSFRALVEDTRRRLARDYLRDPRLELADIAQRLGFSEQSAFQRSFKQWTGETPRHFRRKPTPPLAS